MGGGRQIYPCFCPLTLVYVLYTFTHKNFVMCREDAMRDTDETGTITLAFRAPRALAAAADRAAAKEGLSRSAVARRALLRDLQSQSSETPDCAAADKSEPEHEHNQTATTNPWHSTAALSGALRQARS